MPSERWGDTEPAPDFEEALRKAGLPVTSCVRQRHEPYWVRTVYTRRLNLDERNLADKVKAAVKDGTFDKLLAKLTRPPKPKPLHDAPAKMQADLKRLALINSPAQPSKWDNSESVPELAEEMRKAGLPVDWCERMTRPPHWIRTHFTREPTASERNKSYAIRHKARNGNLPPDKPAPIKKTKPPVALPPVTLTENYSGTNVEMLAAAVIETAVKDAKLGDEEAIRFLCAPDGPWATSRDTWAIVAGIDTDLLHEWSLSSFAA
ncbi:hypothetical protein [Alteraurantiacibacter aquimixticola]|uniref:Uncharacterized protein n=1 Tax=Alteraurantiacibacter aquimixticola TaxID=2489173 RepID=A0A4T3EXU0_9SPHN|nr:hypothetical protein [Alteraurantiacibacter aquimixticola]TIX48851.1 hypothetical protein E5222_13990 [Alteraurantiacibacter aquimixticola]